MFGDNKLYVTLNALFFEKIKNETIKVREGKKLNPAIVHRYEDIVSLCTSLFEIAFEYKDLHGDEKVYRVERYSDFLDCLRSEKTISFTSTSKEKFLNEYTDKIGLVLMEINIPRGTPCIDFAKVLPEYKKADESEILLMPNLRLSFTETQLSEEEKKIKDHDGNPPLKKYIVQIEKGYAVPEIRETQIDNVDKASSVRLLKMMNETKGWVKFRDFASYNRFKKYVLNEINKKFIQIFSKSGLTNENK